MISKWECGTQTPSKHYQEKLCLLFGKSASELGFLPQQEEKHLQGQNPQQPLDLAELQKLVAQAVTQGIIGGVRELGSLDLNELRRKILGIPLEIAVGKTSIEHLPFLGGQTLSTSYEFARILLKPSTIMDEQLSDLEGQTALLWKYRDDGILLTECLYLSVERHLQQIIRLLDGSLYPSIRIRLLTIASKTSILCGALLYDLGLYEQARKYLQLAIRVSDQASQPVPQAIAWTWISFTWTYQQQYQNAYLAISQAISLLTDPEQDRETFAWSMAVAAEIVAQLKKYDECLSFLEQSETSQQEQSDRQNFYLHGFTQVALGGFRGRCYQLLYDPEKAETVALLEKAKGALEQSLHKFSVSERQKMLYRADLASIYAIQGQIEMACALTRQNILLVNQTTPQNVFQRFTEMKHRLQPWKETSYVRDLDDALSTIGIV
jgi:tetratricopeptide (TPR) repeat protein